MAELINDTEGLEDVVSYIDVGVALEFDRVTDRGRNAGVSAAYPTGGMLASLAAGVATTELELVTEARRQALEGLERRTTEHGRANTQALVDELDEWLKSA